MTRRDQAIEVAAKAHAEYDILRWRIETEDSDEELPSGGVFGAIADALLTAGVIPAEGTVVVERGRAERLLDLALSYMEYDDSVIERAAKAIRPSDIADDLYVIPAAPTEEGEQ